MGYKRDRNVEKEEIDGEDAFGHLGGDGEKKEKIMTVEEKIESQEDWPEGIHLEMGQVGEMKAGEIE